MSKNSKLVVGLTVCLLIAISMFIFLSITNKVNPANVSRDKYHSWIPTIALDSKDKPHISWGSGDKKSHLRTQVNFVSLSGNEWVGIDKKNQRNRSINPWNTEYIREVSFVLDSKNNPNIVYYMEIMNKDRFQHIVFSKWNGENWVSVDNSPSNSALGKANFIIGDYPSLALDSHDNPHITWATEYLLDDYDIMYTKWNGENWVTASGEVYDQEKNNANVSKGISDSYSSKLVLDSKDNPCLMWKVRESKKTFPGLYFVKWNGAGWITIDGEIYDPETGNANVTMHDDYIWEENFTLDSEDNPHIVWNYSSDRDRDKTFLSYIKWNGANWVEADGTIYSPDTVSSFIDLDDFQHKLMHGLSITLDSKSQPHLVWHHWIKGKNNIFYTRWDGENWVTISNKILDPSKESANVSNNNYNSYKPVIVLDSNDYPHITWQDTVKKLWRSNTEIMYVRWNGENWVCADGSIYKPSE